MTNHITRFAGKRNPKIRATFADLFGKENFDRQWLHLIGREREGAIVDGYCQRLREVGNFPFAGSSVVLNPYQDRSHYHLVFTTRNIVGLQVYRNAEAKALALQSSTRKQTQQQARIATTGQQELFDAQETSRISYVDELLRESHQRATQYLQRRLATPSIVSYRTLAGELMSFPMVSERHAKTWLMNHHETGRIRFLTPKHTRVPSLNRNDRVIILPVD